LPELERLERGLRRNNLIECVYRDADANPSPVQDPFDFAYGHQG
jgi:hypothetical protein